MKVLVVTNLFPSPLRLNRAAYNRQQFLRLSETHDVTVLVAIAWLEWVKNIGSYRNEKMGKLNIRYFPYFYIPKIAVYLHSFYMFLSMLPQIPYIFKYKPDVLLASWAFPDAVASAAWCRILNIPLVVKVHGSDINVKSKNPGHRKQIEWALRNADIVVSVSKALCRRLSELGVGDNRIKLLYNGVDLDVFRPETKQKANESLGLIDNQKKILFVGNLELTKGCKELLTAFADLLEGGLEVQLYYVGRGRAEKELKTQAEKLGCLDKVHFKGEAQHKDLVHWYNAVDLICLPSYNEGVPNVLLEAMACGLPVVATRVGGIPEVVSGESGILVEKQNPDALIVALRTVLDKKWDKGRIIKGIKGFSWDSNLSKLEGALLKSVK